MEKMQAVMQRKESINMGELFLRQIKKIVRSSMFLKTKSNAKGSFEKLKQDS